MDVTKKENRKNGRKNYMIQNIKHTTKRIIRTIILEIENNIKRSFIKKTIQSFVHLIKRIVNVGFVMRLDIMLIIVRKKEKKTEILKIAYDLGYEPLEDSDVDSDIEIYAYTSESDYSN